MMLSDGELTAARDIIRRGLDEDLRYGPDVTTTATVPAERGRHGVAGAPGARRDRRRGRRAAGARRGARCRRVPGARPRRGRRPVAAGSAPADGAGGDPRPVDRRADHAEPDLPPVRDRHRDGGLGRRGATAPRPRSATPARPCPACGRCRSTRCASAAASTTGWGSGDAALIKDNHVAAAGSVVDALRAVRDAAPDLPCEVEVDSLEQLDEVLLEEPELILLDNFPVWQTQMAVQRRDARAPACCSSRRAGSAWRPRRPTPRPGWTTWPSGR